MNPDSDYTLEEALLVQMHAAQGLPVPLGTLTRGANLAGHEMDEEAVSKQMVNLEFRGLAQEYRFPMVKPRGLPFTTWKPPNGPHWTITASGVRHLEDGGLVDKQEAFKFMESMDSQPHKHESQ